MSASESGERKSIGEKTHISLRSACLVMLVAVVPLTVFLARLSFGIDELKAMHGTDEKRLDEHEKKLQSHEMRIHDLELKK